MRKGGILNPQPSNLRCSYCHDSLGLDIAHCQYCGTLIHNDCWKEHGSCICGKAFVVVEKSKPRNKPKLLGSILYTLGAGLLSFIVAILVAAANYYIPKWVL